MVVPPGVRKCMQSNRSMETGPERRLRQALWAMGLRGYRKNAKGLPGKPDIAFVRARVAVFVHGCFWHGCPDCVERKNLRPKTNAGYWQDKVKATRDRDDLHESVLEGQGWRVVVVWEHELRPPGGPEAVALRIRSMLLGEGDESNPGFH